MSLNQKVFITGTAGFIGFHLAKLLIDNGYDVHGYDGMTEYYDINLKRDRNKILLSNDRFSMTEGMLEDKELLSKVIKKFKPDMIVHLAAQAGVRYSLENPRAYIESNIIGTFNLMEIIREIELKHFLFASTSSAYGGNTEMPFLESHKTDSPLTLYAATKKSCETMMHAYSHLYKIPTTIFRFFTVYGPWGRPDMALFKFTKGIIEDTPIDVYNHGKMQRDFTFVDDLVSAIFKLLDVIPDEKISVIENDSLSKVAPIRVVNIGNSKKVELLNFIKIIEKKLGKEAKYNFMEMQQGDVPSTWASNNLLYNLTGFTPVVSVEEGVSSFVDWYCHYYKKDQL